MKKIIFFLITCILLTACNNSELTNEGIGLEESSAILVGDEGNEDEESKSATSTAGESVTNNENESNCENDNMKEGIFETYAKEELLEDLDIVVSKIESVHPKLFIDEEKFQEVLSSSENYIYDGMTKLEFTRYLSLLVATLNCGHTNVSYVDNLSDVKRFADKVYAIGNKMYLKDNTFYEEIPLGSEIVSINDRTSEEIITILLNSIPSDGTNQTRQYYIINNWFNITYLKYVEYADNFTIDYIKPDGTIATIDVEAYDYNYIRPRRTNNNEEWVPHYSVFESDYAIIRMEEFYPFDEYTVSVYKEFIDSFFSEVANTGIENVILDIRGNSGGDPRVTSHLFSYLAKSPQSYWAEGMPTYYSDLNDSISLSENNYEGKLYVLIDGGCFSSTGHLVSLLRHQEIGVFIGEETGGSYVCTDSSKDVYLKNTGVKFHYSTQVWQVNTEGIEAGIGIVPDYVIVPSIDEVIQNRDIQLEYVLEMIKEER